MEQREQAERGGETVASTEQEAPRQKASSADPAGIAGPQRQGREHVRAAIGPEPGDLWPLPFLVFLERWGLLPSSPGLMCFLGILHLKSFKSIDNMGQRGKHCVVHVKPS